MVVNVLKYLWLLIKEVILKCVVVNVLKYTEVIEHLFSRGYEYWGLYVSVAKVNTHLINVMII